MPGGRPTKYTPAIVKKARDYLVNYNTEYDHAIPSVIGMAIVLNLGKSTLYDWSGQSENEFSDILPLCNDYQHFKLVDGGLKGELNSNIVKLALGKHGYSEKKEIEVTDLTKMDPDQLARKLAESEQDNAASKVH